MKFKLYLGIFLSLITLFIPFHLWSLNLERGLLYTFVEPLLIRTTNFIEIRSFNKDLLSDGVLQYILIIYCLILAIPIYLACIKWVKNKELLLGFTYKLSLLVLSFFMVKYGLDKLMGNQFNIVEGNLLHKELKDFSKDLLFWVSIKSSNLFVYTSGSIELIGGVMLLNSFTRKLGLIICLISCSFIVLLNFSFDINVKILSMYLFVSCLFSLLPYLKNISQAVFPSTKLVILFKEQDYHKLNPIVLSLFIVFTIAETISSNNTGPVINHREWSGSYKLKSAETEYLHLHSDAYYITERNGVFTSEKMQVYKENKKQYSLQFKTKKSLKLHCKDSVNYLLIDGVDTLMLKKLSFNNCSYLEDEFNWTTEASLK